jgi:hypothetical protein
MKSIIITILVSLLIALFLSLSLPAQTTNPITLVPGTAMTYTDGTYTWAGNPNCIGPGYNFTLQSTSPAIDAGTITEINCPQAGSALNQPRLPDGSYCSEWYGSAPDIGACEYVAQVTPPPNPVPTAPMSLNVASLPIPTKVDP